MLIKISVILLFAVGGCNISPSMNKDSQNSKSINAMEASIALPKNIWLFIGRGSCCYGHIISIDEKGNLKYSVGKYSIPDSGNGSEVYLPEVFEPSRITIDRKYGEINQQVSAEVLRKLDGLMGDEEKLSFRDNSLVYDSYIYNVYFNRKAIGHGYESKMEALPTNLRELIRIVTSEVTLHKLPGMA